MGGLFSGTTGTGGSSSSSSSAGYRDVALASGELDAIHQKWFGSPLPELPPLPQF